jgi:hypothetical protein
MAENCGQHEGSLTPFGAFVHIGALSKQSTHDVGIAVGSRAN